MADAAKIGRLAALVWSIAELLRGDFKQSEYGRIVLPFVVLRRLDGVLASTKDAVLDAASGLAEDTDDEAKGVILGAVAGHGPSLWNTSRFTFATMRAQNPGDIHRNLIAYITAFSPAVRDVFLDKFQFPEQLKRLEAAGLLWKVFEKFCEADLSPEAVTNNEMGYLFEDLIRRLSEISNETAGEQYTPREVIRLIVSLLIGVIISDDQTMVYAPVSRNVEAGATSSDRPNAIVLGGKATEAVAVASGSAPPPESPDIPVSEQPKQEIGGEALDPAKVKDMEVDLQANPPRPFDLTRRLTVFVTEVQFVELRLSNAVFSSRKTRLLPHFLKFNGAKLRNDIDSTLSIPIDFQSGLKVKFTSWRGEEEMTLNEGDLKRERDAIERTFLCDWKGRGKVILRKDKDHFRKELQRLIIMATEYQNALKSKFEEHKKVFS